MRRTTTADAAGQKNGEKNRNNKKNALELKFRLFSLRFFCILIYFIFSSYVRIPFAVHGQTPRTLHSGSWRLSTPLFSSHIFYFIPARLKARKFKFHFITYIEWSTSAHTHTTHSTRFRKFIQLKCAPLDTAGEKCARPLNADRVKIIRFGNASSWHSFFFFHMRTFAYYRTKSIQIA